MKRENLLAILRLAAILAALMSVPAMAQQWPARTIRAVVPLTAGSAVDIVPRIVLEQVAAQIGQSIVVENRTGASGTIGIRLAAGFQGDFIPFRGAPEVLTEVMTGRVDAYYAPLSAALEFIRTGKLVALSVSSVQRSSALPDIPTSIEAGYPNSDLNFWIGIFAPAGTPPDIVAKLSREIGIALANPALREKLANQGVDPMTMGADEFQSFVNAEAVAMGRASRRLIEIGSPVSSQ